MPTMVSIYVCSNINRWHIVDVQIIFISHFLDVLCNKGG